jgi:hypothetical protein
MSLIKQDTHPRLPLYRLIPLTQGQWTLVSLEDYEYLSRWKWNAWQCPRTKKWYAVRTERNPGPGSRRRNIWMHREVLGLKPGNPLTGDHIETRETLDNRRSNLRIATPQQQCCNQVIRKDNRSGFKGVFQVPNGKFVAYTAKNGKLIHHGTFDTITEAAAKRAAEAVKLYGDFARER